jgi:Gpi18-like mannosyltransferase
VLKEKLSALKDVRLSRYENTIIVGTAVALAALLRYSLLGFESRDFTLYFDPWYGTIKEQGFEAFRSGFSNYPPLYLYFLYLISVVIPQASALAATKLPSLVSDFVCAWFSARIVGLKYGRDHPASLFAFFAILFAPTVVLNGSFWGQIDSIFTAAMVACVYFLLKKREAPAWIAFAVAFSIKLQTIFLAPLLLVLLFKRVLSWKYVPIVPIVYVLTILPAWFVGRPLPKLLTLYVSQVGQFPALVMNAPNLYTWLPQDLYSLLYPAGLIYAAIMVFLFVVMVYKSRAEVTPSLLVQLAFVSVIIVPYFLPKVHDRYFYPSDVFSILYGFFLPSIFWVPIVVNTVSFFTYVPYLFGAEKFPLSSLALVLLFVIVVAVHRMVVALYGGRVDR